MSDCTIEQLRELVAIQANDAALWDVTHRHIETAYIQQGLRIITKAIEGELSYEVAREILKDLAS